jgi:hypothetical protein
MTPVDPETKREQNRLRQQARRNKQTGAGKINILVWVEQAALDTAKSKAGATTNQELVDVLIERIIKEEQIERDKTCK